jgi:hypothetical protein
MLHSVLHTIVALYIGHRVFPWLWPLDVIGKHGWQDQGIVYMNHDSTLLTAYANKVYHHVSMCLR